MERDGCPRVASPRRARAHQLSRDDRLKPRRNARRQATPARRNAGNAMEPPERYSPAAAPEPRSGKARTLRANSEVDESTEVRSELRGTKRGSPSRPEAGLAVAALRQPQPREDKLFAQPGHGTDSEKPRALPSPGGRETLNPPPNPGGERQVGYPGWRGGDGPGQAARDRACWRSTRVHLTPGDIGLAQSPKPIEGLSATVARRNPEAHRSAGRGIPSLEGAESGREAEEKNESGGRPLRCDGRRCLPELRTPAAPTRGYGGAWNRAHPQPKTESVRGPGLRPAGIAPESTAERRRDTRPPSALQGPAAEATGPFGTETEAGPSPPVTEGLHR
ncbi:hypothetical protein WMY93_028710 [Mugilogobius chulae]|uniref:Uncharacterized protein n=1 Tax=Mugilogobius chulae TaxID=88201 RepID=A0AAW0N0V5_9GOBI